MKTEKKVLLMADKRAKETWANADFLCDLYNKGAKTEDMQLITGWDPKTIGRLLKLAQSFPTETRTLSIPISVYEVSCEFPNPQETVELAWQRGWHRAELQELLDKSYIPHNEIQPAKKTPLEVALDIDDQGMTTARKLYLFLELHPAAYSRWAKKNIEENIFAEINEDYEVFNIDVENPTGGRPTRDYKITSSFAKKLAMASHSSKGEEVRNYFIAIEQKMKAIANGEINPQLASWVLESAAEFGKEMLPATVKRFVRFAKTVKNDDKEGA